MDICTHIVYIYIIHISYSHLCSRIAHSSSVPQKSESVQGAKNKNKKLNKLIKSNNYLKLNINLQSNILVISDVCLKTNAETI